MTKILITGGAGFIGTHTADFYLKQNSTVTIFDNFSRRGTHENIQWLKKTHPGKILRVIIGDVRRPGALDKAVKNQDLIIHLAAQVAVTSSVKNPREDFEINALGTFNVLESIRTNSPKSVLIFASTNKVYGEMENIKVKKGPTGYKFTNFPQGVPESQNLDFHSPYGCSKGTADQYIHDYHRIYGLKTVVFRQSCIYGTRQFGIEDQGWVSWFTIASILGKPIFVYGDGFQVRDVLFATDLVRAYDLAFKKIKTISGQVFNIGGGPANSLCIRDLLKVLENKLNKKIPFKFASWRPGDQKVYVSDIHLVSKDLGWRPQISVDRGLSSLITWTQENRGLVSRVLN